METIFLTALGKHAPCIAHPASSLSLLNKHVLFLQAHVIELRAAKSYAIGACDYIWFCITHALPLELTPLTLSRYITYISQFISSGPKYLTGVHHFLKDLYPDFDISHKHPMVQATIHGSRKTRGGPTSQKLPLQLFHLITFCLLANISDSYDDLLFTTILACCFYGCHQSGELIWQNDKQLQDFCKIIKHSSFILQKNDVQYHLPYNKSDPFYYDTDILLT
ncbi:uncharacterized protein BT62DRAFT_912285 [Guyanagaster necrorhizus]|uniref:Uncharacterized protein n=1 Tax=Guyanagaster necrorhizus TaxID=856835 RepID=A0A9P7VG76_9AGAR|nr:uncharacterized protein BT62DRAFT_912285 [Guyanagaster necrorhizus MCA 3950]KAG7439815.1 hypothetical protein BT62DRAFT_912285 [Guyanagaster necrorhizus MCA 3950]